MPPSPALSIPHLQNPNRNTAHIGHGSEEFEVYEELFANSEPRSDNGSTGSQDTPKEEPQEEEGAVPETQPLPKRETGSEQTEGSSEPSPGVETSVIQPFLDALGVKPVDRSTIKPEKEVATTGAISSSEPLDNPGNDDDESVKSSGSKKQRKKTSKARRSLLPATTPEGGKDSKETDLLVHSM